MNPKTYTSNSWWKNLRAASSELRKETNGFTLIDVMFAITIVGLLAAMAIPLLARAQGSYQKSKEAAGISDPDAIPAPVAPPASTHVEFPWEVILGVGIGAIIFVGFVVAIVRLSKRVINEKNLTQKNIEGWKSLEADHKAVISEWMDYEMDIIKTIDFPMLSDMAEPVTVAFHQAMKTAQLHAPKTMKGLGSVPFGTSDYAKAVRELETAWKIAESKARLSSWSMFDLDEKKRLQKAKDLLALALDSGATTAERQISYKAAMKTLKGLIEVPKKTLVAIEEKNMLKLAA